MNLCNYLLAPGICPQYLNQSSFLQDCPMILTTFQDFPRVSHVVHMFFPVPKDFPMDFSTPAAPQSPLLPWHQRPARLRRLSGATTSCCGPPWCLRWKSDGFVSRFFWPREYIDRFPIYWICSTFRDFSPAKTGI